MSERISRIVFLLFIVAGSIRLSAQLAPKSDVGIWTVGAQLTENDLSEDGDDVRVEFEDQGGLGISFNHFWTDTFSTEIAAQKYSSDMNITTDLGGTGSLTFKAGDLDITAVTAMGEWHFRRATRFAPYVGAGIARISGEFDPVDDPDDPEFNGPFDLESKITWTAAVGANIRLTDHIALAGEFKYIPWSAFAEGDTSSDSIDLDPLTLSLGVKARF
jgi:outer membrane protein W